MTVAVPAVARSTSASSSVTTSPLAMPKSVDRRIVGDVLLTTANAQGHFRPMMALGELLSRYSGGALRCHLLATIPDDAKIPTTEYPNVNVLRIQLPDDVAQPSELINQFHWLVDNKDAIISQGAKYAKSLNVVAICYDLFFEWGFQLAERLGIKHFGVCTSPLYCYYLWAKRACFVDRDGPTSEEQRMVEGVGVLSEDAMPHVPPLASYFGAMVPYLKSSRSLITNDSPCQAGWSELSAAANKFLLTPRGKHDKGSIHPLGYLNDHVSASDAEREPTQDEQMVVQWLEQHEPNTVIFIALGSWVELRLHDLAELAEALAILEAPFLWALRDRSNPPTEEEIRKIGHETDSRGLPSDYLEKVISHSYVTPWVNQRQVLAHPSIKLFITHCGWNSLTEALSLTPAPKAFIPVASEQFINAEVAEKAWMIGLELWSEKDENHDRKYLDREVLTERINKCCTDPAILESSLKFWEEHRHHLETGAKSYIRRLLAEIDS